MNYPVAIHKDAGSDFGVTVPDLPGCFSAGKTLDDALANVREAIELHIESLIDAGEPVPRPSPLDAHVGDPALRGAVWAIVSTDMGKLRLNAVRVQFSLPARSLDLLDRAARDMGETRSGLLLQAVSEMLGRKVPRAKLGRPRVRQVKVEAAKSKGRARRKAKVATDA
jgi:predicted RNase H-like HicB family nuclease